LYIPESWTHQNVSHILNVTTKTGHLSRRYSDLSL
jgi:hypothetical protein